MDLEKSGRGADLGVRTRSSTLTHLRVGVRKRQS